jgi:hypothetical protein
MSQHPQGVVLTIMNIGIMVMTVGIAAIPEDDEEDDKDAGNDVDNEDVDAEGSGHDSRPSFSFRPTSQSMSANPSDFKDTRSSCATVSTKAKWVAEHEDSDDESSESGDESSEVVIKNPLSAASATDNKSLSLSAMIRHTPRSASNSRSNNGGVDIEMTSTS